MLWLGGKGAAVFIPVFHSPDFDLVADWGNGLIRVQVKTTALFRNRRWVAAVCTRGGNQSWSGLVKKLDSRRYDYLFVHVGDGRRWFMPSSAAGGGCSISLGGPLYAEFEIEPGDPLPAYSAGVQVAARR
jgi:PD-(D/E)XK endonuclease